MYKKIIFALCFVAIIFSINVQAASAADSNIINLQGAIDRAKVQNRALLLVNQKLSLAIDRLKDAPDDLEKQKRQNTIMDLTDQVAQQKNDIEVNVTKLYYQILINQKQISLERDIIDRLNTEFDMKKKSISLGKDAESSLADSELNLENAKNQLLDLQNGLESLIMDLNNAMGDDLNRKISLQDSPIPDNTINISDVGKVADDLANIAPSVNKLVRNEQAAYGDKNNASSDTAKQQADDNILSIQNDIDDERVTVEYNVRSGYNNILNLKDQMEIKNLDYNKYIKISEGAQIKYDYGLITSIDRDKAKQDASNALYLLFQSKLDYYLEIKKYNNLTTF